LPTNWIGHIYLTDEVEITDASELKIHTLIPCDQGAGVPISPGTYPELFAKGVEFVPNMTAPSGSPWPYKIVADA